MKSAKNSNYSASDLLVNDVLKPNEAPMLLYKNLGVVETMSLEKRRVSKKKKANLLIQLNVKYSHIKIYVVSPINE